MKRRIYEDEFDKEMFIITKFLNNKKEFHRKNGPAFIRAYKDGTKEREIWMQNDNFHRADGPAIIYYNRDGTIFYKKYYINDKEITDPLQIIVIEGNK